MITSLAFLSLFVFQVAGKPSITPTAEQIVERALQVAKREKKQVFLSFGATWCAPCKHSEAFLHSPDVQAILKKYFVFAKVWTLPRQQTDDNNQGGEAMLKRMTNDQVLPSHVLLDASGKVRTDFLYTYPTGQKVRLSFPEGEMLVGKLLKCMYDANPAVTNDDLWKLRRLMESGAGKVEK
jgi:thiol:disulfide interchange protein